MFYNLNFVKIYFEDVRIWFSAYRDIKRIFMNLNEECLIKYLQSPDDLSCCTDVLKLNNQILEQHFILENFLTKNLNLGYNNKCQ